MAEGEPARNLTATASVSGINRDAGSAAPPLPVRDPGATQVRAPGAQIRALDDLEILRRVLAALHGL